MKKILLSFFVFGLFTLGLAAQQISLPAVYETAEQLTARYELSDEQQAELSGILATRTSNLEAINELREENEPLFWQKRRAIYVGQQASIERILTSKEQHTALAELRISDRRAESDLIKELLAAGHSRDEARLMLLRQRY